MLKKKKIEEKKGVWFTEAESPLAYITNIISVVPGPCHAILPEGLERRD